MIRRFLNKVFGQKPHRHSAKLHALTASQHSLRPQAISPCALRVIKTLQENGFQAYVVGGAVRDLLLQKSPKDFDVATNATPEQIRRLIRRSRIIGRRFQIIHVPCHDEIVEVTTFRGHAPHDHHSQTDEHGRLTRDNVFGSLEEDATRRDFTANALFYDPVHNTLLDYFSGTKDIAARRLVMIGDPVLRFREDPVRLLRAIRFSAKLGFTLDAALIAPLRELGNLLAPIPESRLFDELLKLLLSGQARSCLELLHQFGLHTHLLPHLDSLWTNPDHVHFITLALDNTDGRLQDKKPVSPGFLLAALFWPSVQILWQTRQAQGEPLYPALFGAMEAVLDEQRKTLPIPHRFDGTMKEIWGLQPRFEQRSGQRPSRLLEHPRFRAGYDFLLLRAASGNTTPELGVWWTTFLEADPDTRPSLLVQETRKPRSRRRRSP
ncbi:polynucleotide adenylyltransferase PcnB [Ferrovum myxofaciens]|jgi:poly(A) polymerase|uniref:Poly(A) polymerase I n=1 Tax=Ferrovum myxofaciens TaxID=416213 RepID=A0A8F3E087_9PROT|nr:polynucleotide adenylyltransferase PcnB [Ferrovum myxofaciens]NDU90703.1 polynucleotide adenylyltransferase PcnB [Ferrovum sp.]KXW57860.1 poly(A) polymerase I precursor [Ferrovum myxofaciens]MBU6993953.1 polynucleotide adenylyltransferase PcnB [Ferrovum myxofaciens]QKE37899.1 MAG: polynucleotide adenylyltransferase PcnB [Ferrovum myxofaciens]QKE40510.1 MAG: polynucleotide adenylyltransferase PcnB [Ferrovum myxofaciens]